MANFEYTGVTAGIRQSDVEGLLEKIDSTLAGKIAGLAGLTDAGADGDYDVTSDAEYNELIVQTMAITKKKLK